MNDDVIRQILTTSDVIATVGLSANPAKTSHGVAQYLIKQGYDVIPVNPGVDEIFGRKAYPDLISIPRKIDVVQIFRPSSDVPPIVDQAIQIGAKVVWMQEGITNPEAAETARAAGLQVVMDRCMRQEHIRLVGHIMDM
ncbi:MAG TPA: CoA-binding protein [Anaerolineales bacterium]